MATPEETRNVGIGLLVGGVVAGGLDAVLFWLAADGAWKNVVLIIFACIFALLAVYLIGYEIMKIVQGSS